MPTAGERAVDGVDDTYLVERILADPDTGWAAAWERYGHQLHSFCLRMLDDPADADDAVSDVFLVAAQRIDQLRNPEAFRAWLYAIARRRIQRRWRDRGRTTPVDPHGATVMNAAVGDLDPSGSGDAAELLAAASAGLNDRDRELLALTLGADLDTTEVARITGQSTNAISVRVTRLKETVGRAAGALLVARHHRRDCDALDSILAEWDGTFDTVWRKRIARHIDSCDDCTRRRAAAGAVFAAPLLLAPPTGALRDRVLRPISTHEPMIEPDLGPWDNDGFPTTSGRWRNLALWATIAVGLILVLVLAVVTVIGDGGGGGQGLFATVGDGPADQDTTTSTMATSTTTTSTTVPDDVAAPPTTAATPPPTTQPSVIPAPTPAPAAPTVTLGLSPDEITANGEQTTEATVVVTAAEGASTTVHWNGPEPGSVVVSGTGMHTVTIGPFSSGAATVTVTATTTASGHTASVTSVLTVYPMPG